MTFRVAAWQEIFELDGPSGLGAIRKGEDITNEAAGRPKIAHGSKKSGDCRALRRLVPRNVLSRRFGRCLGTEHGRMAVCTDDPGNHEAHCFHVHFLLFSGARDVSEKG
jgi:hypothetical protein